MGIWLPVFLRNETTQLALLGGCTAASIFANLIGCVHNGNYFPLFIIGTYAIALSSQYCLKTAVQCGVPQATWDAGKGTLDYWGDFFTAFFIGSSFGLGGVLRSAELINTSELVTSQVSGVVFWLCMHGVVKVLSSDPMSQEMGGYGAAI